MQHLQEVIAFQFVNGADRGLPPPTKASQDASGYDLRADLLRAEPTDLSKIISPGEWTLVPTGLKFEIPRGMEGQIRPRSGLALKHGITVLNSPGTIDSDYRGEIGIILINHGKQDFIVSHGDRIAQIVFMQLPKTYCVHLDTLTVTERGDLGFGSSGNR